MPSDEGSRRTVVQAALAADAGYGYARNSREDRLPSRPACARVYDIGPEIGPAIYPGEDDIRFAVDGAEEGEHDAVHRCA